MAVGSIRRLLGGAVILARQGVGGLVWGAPMTVVAVAELQPNDRFDTADRPVSATKAAIRPIEADGLAIPWTSSRRVARRTPPGPDDILEPTFIERTFGPTSGQTFPPVDTFVGSTFSWVGLQRCGRAMRPLDPDAILVPTFAEVRTSRAGAGLRGADDLIDPWKNAPRGVQKNKRR